MHPSQNIHEPSGKGKRENNRMPLIYLMHAKLIPIHKCLFDLIGFHKDVEMEDVNEKPINREEGW
jgi:hypothetical protein